MSSCATQGKAWVLGTEAGRIMGVDRRHVTRLAKQGLIAVRRIPGADPRYCRRDVEAVAERFTTPTVPVNGVDERSDSPALASAS